MVGLQRTHSGKGPITPRDYFDRGRVTFPFKVASSSQAKEGGIIWTCTAAAYTIVRLAKPCSTAAAYTALRPAKPCSHWATTTAYTVVRLAKPYSTLSPTLLCAWPRPPAVSKR
jgi:hypothetical protein